MVVMTDGVMMRFVMNTVMVMTRMVLIATAWIPRTAGLCRRKRSGENDHCECNFQVHVVFLPYLRRVYMNSGQLKGVHNGSAGR
jgi:hypothetical protein